MKVQAGYETASHADRQLDHHYKLRLPAQLAARPGLKHGTDRLASWRMGHAFAANDHARYSELNNFAGVFTGHSGFWRFHHWKNQSIHRPSAIHASISESEFK